MELINWAAAKLFFDIAQAVLMGGVAVYVWWTNRTRATGTAITQVNKRIDEVDKHVSSLEQTLENRPGYTEIEALRSELAEMNRGMAQISAQMQSTTALLNRLHEYLLTEKGKR
ncbi:MULTISPECIES: DUF2730 family protein [Vreelandella]|uniref:DUF2730 family protein n=2 Tax=Vreelandella TaxID=3137766 RepID=A0A7Y6RFG2_9GAMM|nr:MULTISPECIES: DUF2730 family protein [Halomonas]NVF15982.1 DUF2730 family protein [Halomonas maris]SES15132.1 Protein of unknown function [Halomonas subterranea]